MHLFKYFVGLNSFFLKGANLSPCIIPLSEVFNLLDGTKRGGERFQIHLNCAFVVLNLSFVL